jgi:hypothetical protein
MTEKYRQLCGLLCGSALILILAAWLFDDFMKARRFVRYGVEERATILELDHVVGGRSSTRYVYSLQIGHTIMLKKFPYNWTVPIQRSFLVLSDSPRPDDIALGNRNSSAMVVACYMEGCDIPGNLLIFSLASLAAVTVVPCCWLRLIRTWAIS